MNAKTVNIRVQREVFLFSYNLSMLQMTSSTIVVCIIKSQIVSVFLRMSQTHKSCLRFNGLQYILRTKEYFIFDLLIDKLNSTKLNVQCTKIDIVYL